MKEKEWIIGSYDDKQVLSLSRDLGISNILAKLLINRNYCNSEAASKFLSKAVNNFYSPFLMKDVEIGANLLLDSIDKNHKILIWGDYDVDGVTSVTVLSKYIKSIGGICEYYIPKRDDDGYGLNSRVLNEYIKNGIKLIITVDSGITAINEIQSAIDMGVNVIVTDHHECRSTLPSANAVINPKRNDCEYPFKELAGVGVVFKFICGVEILYSKCSHIEALTKLLDEYAEFVAIGTIADVMPIRDENRLIVSKGLSAIEHTSNKGLSALLEESEIIKSDKRKKISSTTVGFVLAPKINAAGRMKTSKIAVELFMTESREEAAKLAVQLTEINKERQNMESQTLHSALEKVSTQCDLSNDKILVLSDDEWHHGIIGIVSSRITERYNLPSVLISFKNEIKDSDPEIGKGSARSIKGMNLVKSLEHCSDLLHKFGGHELAAGLSISRSKLQEFKTRINEYAKKAFENVSLTKALEIDCEIEPQEMSIKLTSELSRLEPFGLSNLVPVFAIKDMQISSIIPIGEGKHTKLILEKNGCKNIALLFGTPTYTFNYLEGDKIDVAFNLDVNTFKNQQNVQMIVRDIQPSKFQRDIISQHLNAYHNLLNNELHLARSQDIPTRTDFAQIYTVLKELLCSASANAEYYEVYLPYLLKLVTKKYSVQIPLYKAMIILDVLAETGLIKTTTVTDPLYRNLLTTYTPSHDTKVVLENAPTLKKLFSKEVNHRKDIN